MRFPKTLYVNWAEDSNGDPIFNTATEIEFIDRNVEEVAIYELKEVKKLKMTQD